MYSLNAILRDVVGGGVCCRLELSFGIRVYSKCFPQGVREQCGGAWVVIIIPKQKYTTGEHGVITIKDAVEEEGLFRLLGTRGVEGVLMGWRRSSATWRGGC
jgi:hypothetical protein